MKSFLGFVKSPVQESHHSGEGIQGKAKETEPNVVAEAGEWRGEGSLLNYIVRACP